MNGFCPYLIQERHIVRRDEPDVQPLGEVHIGTAVWAGMLHGIRQVRPWPVAGAAADQPVGIGDGDCVLGVGVREHPALINQVIASLWPPPLHGSALGFVVSGQLHQAQVRPPVAVHVYKANLQNPTFSQEREKRPPGRADTSI